MRGELTLARCLLPPISPIKNILPSRSARSSPGPQLYFINTFRQVQKGMIHAGPERSSREHSGAFSQGRHPEPVQAWPSGGIISLAPRPRITCPQLEGLTHKATFRHPPARVCAQTQPPRAPGTERCRPGPSPTRRGGMSDLPTGSLSPLLLSFFLLRDPADFRAHLSPLDSVPSFPKAWVREGVSCFFPPWLAQRPADGGTRQVPATKIRLLSTERSLGVPREYLAICI